jgi:Tfp pilus assembly ATPase PilU
MSTRISNTATMEEVFEIMKEEVETFEECTSTKGDVLKFIMFNYSTNFTDDQVDQILTFFPNDLKEKIISDLNNGTPWF